MPSYLFDVTLRASVRLDAATVKEAREMLVAALECADTNFGEVSPHSDFECVEIDGEEPTICPSCSAVEGEPEWGTVGDGFDGYCANCADNR